MVIEIKPIHDDAFDCFQSIIVSFAKYYGLGYILMFADSWGFSFVISAFSNSAEKKPETS